MDYADDLSDYELNGRLGLERLIFVTEERFIFVYRLVLDAKPDGGDAVAG